VCEVLKVSTYWAGYNAKNGGKMVKNSQGDFVIASERQMKNLLDGIFGRGYEV